MTHLKYAFRQLLKNKGFTAIAVLTLALGIGANTAIFSAVDAVLIRPLPYADADRLVMVWDDSSQTGGDPKFFSTPPEWNLWRQYNTVFTDIAATQPADAILSGGGEPEELAARKVTGNFWSVLGVQPVLGRFFTEAEDQQGVKAVVVSYGFWQRRYGRSPEAIGSRVVLNDSSYEVIGVMPRDFYFMPSRDIDLWMPTSFSDEMLSNWGWHDVHCVARLKPGVTYQEANETMAALSLRLTAEHIPIARAAVVTSLRSELAGTMQSSLIVLFAASGAILLIACVNLANLLMSRWAARRNEVTIRAALGAGRGRLILQFLTESLLLAGIGAVAGLVLAQPIMGFLETMVPPTMSAVRLTLDARVLLFSAAIALLAGLIFGLVPAFSWTRTSMQEGLREGGRGSSGPRSHRFQHSLIVLETALAVVLLTGGGLLLQSFQHLRQLDLGIRNDNLLTFVTPLLHYPEFEQRVAFVNEELERIRAIPGVVSAGAISRIPLTVNDQSTFYLLEGQSRNESQGQVALSRVVTRDYFTTIGAQLREGRFFDITDRRSDAPVAIINESFADRHFPGQSALGERLKFGSLGERGYWYTVVGVVKEIRDRGVTEELKPAVYRVHEQADQTGDKPSGIVVRTAVVPASIVPAVRQAVWSIDPNQPVARVQTLEDIVDRQLSMPSRNTTLLGAFALVALLLASLGIYGVLSNAVVQRTTEIGVRIALGATKRDILHTFGWRGLKLTLAGLAIGLILASIGARFMTVLFFGFTPGYLHLMVMVSLLLLAVAFLASFLPARRAATVDPVVAFRNQ